MRARGAKPENGTKKARHISPISPYSSHATSVVRITRAAGIMPFSLASFAQRRPYLYHLTAASNLPGIQAERRLHSASALTERANRSDLVGVRRSDHVPLHHEGVPATLRDQSPLHLANIRLDEGWSFDRFVAHLNAHVFFWLGSETGPIDYGERHFARYASEGPVVLRIPFTGLVAANPDAEPLFSKYNSGSPRWSGGVPAPRGESTFVPASAAPFRASEVVEVTFRQSVQVPGDCEWGRSLAGPWAGLDECGEAGPASEG